MELKQISAALANPADSPAPSRFDVIRALLLGFLVAACAYRVWLVFRSNPFGQVWSDMARHWAEGTRPLDATPMSAVDPIGYQLYLGVLGKLSAGSPTLIAYWTSLLSLAGPWLWYRFMRELLPSRNAALAGWLLLAALPSWSAIYSYFMQETLMLPLLGAALWATWRARRKGDSASFIVAVGAWLLAGLTRGICLPLGAVAMGWLWLAQDRRFEKAALSLALLAAVLVPLAGRSWSIARLLSPHGSGQVAYLYLLGGSRSLWIDFTRSGGKERWTYGFVSPSISHPPLAPLSRWTGPRRGELRFPIDLDAGARDWQAAKASLPPWGGWRALELTGESLVHLFFGPSWPDTDIEGNLHRDIGTLNYWMRWLWAPLALVCAVLITLQWQRQRERLLPALLLTWIVVQGLVPLSLNEGRYRKPFEGLLIVQALVLAGGTRTWPASSKRSYSGETRWHTPR
jgi:hypothetical protein